MAGTVVRCSLSGSTWTAFRRPLLLLRQRQARGLLIPTPSRTTPLLNRRADRPLPSLKSINRRTWPYLPVFLAVIAAGAFAIFNYEKLNHSVVSSSLYALRVHPRSREMLGDEIYFAHRVPWIHGKIDPMHGVVDVSFAVKGSKGKGKMRFRCTRRKRGDYVSALAGWWDKCWMC
jgi:cytochrome c oxidase assembly factor 1